jgi:hypothetical protein
MQVITSSSYEAIVRQTKQVLLNTELAIQHTKRLHFDSETKNKYETPIKASARRPPYREW